MATRTILKKGDPSLKKKSREVKDFNERLHRLLDDMRETLEKASGVGLAAPQVGVLRRAFIVIDYNGEEPKLLELINPEITETEGEQIGPEGCLSLPNIWGIVTRPERVRIKAQDRYGNYFETEGRGLTARAFCHELDHLQGVLFDEIADRFLTEEELESLRESEEND
jgi:peptide deformylase